MTTTSGLHDVLLQILYTAPLISPRHEDVPLCYPSPGSKDTHARATSPSTESSINDLHATRQRRRTSLKATHTTQHRSPRSCRRVNRSLLMSNQHTNGFPSPRGHAGGARVTIIPSRALAIHLTTLRRSQTRGRVFRSTADRAFRVLLEEALAEAPMCAVEIVTLDGRSCEGITPERPPCAVVMSECAYPMLEAFRCIQPDSPTGFVTLDHDRENDAHDERGHLAVRQLCAPADLGSHNVFLLDVACATAREAAVAIRSLLDVGASEASIFLVTLVIRATVIAELHAAFPDVHVVTAAVDGEAGSDASSRLDDFQERYFNTMTIRQTPLGTDVQL